MYEYKYIECFADGFFTDDNHQEIINEHAEQGWRFIQMVPIQYNTHGTPKKFEIIFERKLEQKI
jgi:hypothetical protein